MIRPECILKEPISLDMRKEYTIGLRGTRTGDIDLDKTLMSIHAHMTLSGLGRNIKQIDGNTLAFITSFLPLRVKVIGEDLFGPKGNVNVVRLEIMNDYIKNELTNFVKNFGTLPEWKLRRILGLKPNQALPKMSRQQIEEMMEDPAFHMTIWEDDIRKRVIEIGEFEFTQVFLKQVGDRPPIITIDVDQHFIKIKKFNTEMYIERNLILKNS